MTRSVASLISSMLMAFLLRRAAKIALVHQILQVSTREAGGTLGDVHKRVLDVDLQNLSTAPDIRETHLHTAIETARAQQSVVQDVRPVGGRDRDHTAVALEAVHLCEDPIQRLLTLVVAATHAGPALATNCIDLIDEHDARSLLLGLSLSHTPWPA